MRGKIILPNLVLVLLLGIGSYFFLKNSLSAKANQRLADRLKITAGLFNRSEALHGQELLNDVRTQTMSKDVVSVFAPFDEKLTEGMSKEEADNTIHQKWFSKCVQAVESYSELWLETTGKKPELVLLTDRKGVVIARNTTPNACPAGSNISEAMPVIEQALDGKASFAIWSADDSQLSNKNPNSKYCQMINTGLMELAAAPVWYDDDIAGSLLIGFEISNGTAKKKSGYLGYDFAVLHSGNVYSSSLATDVERSKLEKGLAEATRKEYLSKAVSGKTAPDAFYLEVGGEKYMALANTVPGADKKDKVVNVILASVPESMSAFSTLYYILVFMGIAIIGVLLAGVMLGNHFLRPVMAIEEGLLKVINGEFNYRFEVESAEVGGLSYRINQLISVLTGEEEDSESE